MPQAQAGLLYSSSWGQGSWLVGCGDDAVDARACSDALRACGRCHISTLDSISDLSNVSCSVFSRCPGNKSEIANKECPERDPVL